MRVLVAEDDDALRSVLVRGLVEEGYTVDALDRGDEALAVIDWRMPGLSGIEAIAEARRHNLSVPILMLTARDTPSDRIRGLDSGADDYLVKPFDFGEFLARLRALQRRSRTTDGTTITVGPLVLDPSQSQIFNGRRSLSVTRKEFAILEVLMRRAGRAVSRGFIEQHVWPEEGTEVTPNTLDVHIGRLRAKLRGSGVEIQVVRGIGFRLIQSSTLDT
jgi:DNA-binding response OmpR family regulator